MEGVLLCFAVAAAKHSDQKAKQRRKGVIFILYFWVAVHHSGKSGQERKQRLWRKVPDWLSGICLPYLLTQGEAHLRDGEGPTAIVSNDNLLRQGGPQTRQSFSCDSFFL